LSHAGVPLEPNREILSPSQAYATMHDAREGSMTMATISALGAEHWFDSADRLRDFRSEYSGSSYDLE